MHIHEMQTVAIDDPGVVSLSVVWASCAEMAEWIDVLFSVETIGDPRNII